MASRVSNIRSIAITPRSARVSMGVPVSQNRSSGSLYSARPDQMVMTSVRSASNEQILRFVFPFSPQTISYRDMSPEISELQRPGKKPIVAFNRLRARRVDIEFLLAVPFDGMHIDVEKDIKLLEDMAATGRPVWFYNTDSFLASNNYRSGNYNPSFFWSIIDFSFQSVRRNRAQKITQATAVLSLVENTNPSIVVVALPRITYTQSVPRNNPPPAPVKPPERRPTSFTNVNRQAVTQSATRRTSTPAPTPRRTVPAPKRGR